jgi:hypothetical protein
MRATSVQDKWAWVTGLVAVALGLMAHVVAGGSAPAVPVLLAFAALGCLAAQLVARWIHGPLLLLLLSGVTQQLLHLGFDALEGTSPATASWITCTAARSWQTCRPGRPAVGAMSTSCSTRTWQRLSSRCWSHRECQNWRRRNVKDPLAGQPIAPKKQAWLNVNHSEAGIFSVNGMRAPMTNHSFVLFG